MRIRLTPLNLVGQTLFLLSLFAPLADAGPTTAAPTAPLKRVRLIASVAAKSPVASSGLTLNGLPVSNVGDDSRINESEFASNLSTRLDASNRFRVIDPPAATDYEFRGLLFSQQMFASWDAKAILAARYELIDAKTHKTIWRETVVSSCPFRNWGGLLAPEPKIGAAVVCALDKNIDQMSAALAKLNF